MSNATQQERDEYRTDELREEWQRDRNEAEAARAHARARTAKHAQYDGRFDGMVPVRVTRDVRTKMGRAFRAGDVTVADPRAEWTRWSGATRTVWSVANGILTSVPADAVEEL